MEVRVCVGVSVSQSVCAWPGAQVKEWMEQQGIDPQALTYSELIERAESGGRWQEALDLFEDSQLVGVAPNVRLCLGFRV
jgi:hypothetical protein